MRCYPAVVSRRAARNRTLRNGAIVIACGLFAAALTACLASCSSSEATSGLGGDGGPTSDSGSVAPDGARIADAGAPRIEANAIVLVHAAAFPAFRICFKGALGDQPAPSVDLMPESNLVGVDVGTAVRLPARGGQLGRAYAVPEKDLRAFYPNVGVNGPTCGEMLDITSLQSAIVEVGDVTEDLLRGVHALVLAGCRPSSVDPTASVDRCGPDWTSAAGNLRLRTLSLMAYGRSGDTRLSVQLVQLSPSLQSTAEGLALGLGFGPIEAGAPTPFVEGAVPFGKAVPDPPASLDYAAADVASYGASGVFVTLGGNVDDAGAPILPEGGADASARQVVIAQSLADIQKRSAPRSLPADWFSIASSYVLLTVGDTDPRLDDGGRDDDPRRALHLLAIPLATPDAGAPDAAQ